MNINHSIRNAPVDYLLNNGQENIEEWRDGIYLSVSRINPQSAPWVNLASWTPLGHLEGLPLFLKGMPGVDTSHSAFDLSERTHRPNYVHTKMLPEYRFLSNDALVGRMRVFLLLWTNLQNDVLIRTSLEGAAA